MFYDTVLRVLSCFCNYRAEEEKAGCFTLTVFFQAYIFVCVLGSLHHGALSWWSVNCDCGIFWSYSLFIFMAFSVHTHWLFLWHFLVILTVNFLWHFLVIIIVVFVFMAFPGHTHCLFLF